MVRAAKFLANDCQGRNDREPAGLTLPSSKFAVDQPPSSPGHHISRIALTLSAQGSATGWLVLRTTIVLGLTAATSSTSSS